MEIVSNCRVCRRLCLCLCLFTPKPHTKRNSLEEMFNCYVNILIFIMRSKFYCSYRCRQKCIKLQTFGWMSSLPGVLCVGVAGWNIPPALHNGRINPWQAQCSWYHRTGCQNFPENSCKYLPRWCIRPMQLLFGAPADIFTIPTENLQPDRDWNYCVSMRS